MSLALPLLQAWTLVGRKWRCAHLCNVRHMVYQPVGEAGRRGCYQHCAGPNGASHRRGREAEVRAHRQADQADTEVLCRDGGAWGNNVFERKGRDGVSKGSRESEGNRSAPLLRCMQHQLLQPQQAQGGAAPAALMKAAWADTAMIISGSVMPRVAIM